MTKGIKSRQHVILDLQLLSIDQNFTFLLFRGSFRTETEGGGVKEPFRSKPRETLMNFKFVILKTQLIL